MKHSCTDNSLSMFMCALYNNMHRELHTAYAQISRGAVNISKLIEFHHKLFQAHLPSSMQHTHMHVCYVTV